MKFFKEVELQGADWIAALSYFRGELKDVGVSEGEMAIWLKKFLDSYKRSGDYDRASDRVFSELKNRSTKKSTFKNIWKTMFEKQRAGDVVFFANQKWQVDKVYENYQDGQNLYVLHQYEVVDGVNLKIKMMKVLAEHGELPVL